MNECSHCGQRTRPEWWGDAITPPVTQRACFFCEEPSNTPHDICTLCVEKHGEGLADALESITNFMRAEEEDG